MSLYEVHAYRTSYYDCLSEERILLREQHGRPRLDRWISQYLVKYPDGKITVSIVKKKRWNTYISRKLFVETLLGRKYV